MNSQALFYLNFKYKLYNLKLTTVVIYFIFLKTVHLHLFNLLILQIVSHHQCNVTVISNL